jgi:predicted amidohydrolase YtcJ
MRNLVAAALLLVSCAPAPEPADLVLRGGRIVTLDPSRPEATALASRGDRIVAVGTEAEIAPLVGPATEVIDLEGRLALPGFVEGHGHFAGLGRALDTLDLRGARTWDEIVSRVAAEAARRPAGSWILGWGWHQEKWDRPPEPSLDGYPVHESLSAAVPDHPVLLKHAAGAHMGIVNALAMGLAGIDATTTSPEGGEIVRDAGGRPTGVLRETAYALALAAHEADRSRRPAEVREADALREIELATAECLRKGVTSFQDAGSSFEEIDRYRRLAESDRLGVRLWVLVEEPNERLRERLPSYASWKRLGDARLTVGGIKGEMDGALGAHGAWLLERYADLPDSTGLNTTPIPVLEEKARLAAGLGLQMAIHAIGDRAVRETLDLYERVLPEGNGRRFRVEHAQHIHPDDVPRFATQGVVASMQGIHCTSDGPWVPSRLGEERARERSYLWRALLDSGALVSNGTDTPIEDVDPLANFHASVTREMRDGRAFVPEQRMTREEALRSLTVDAARAAFEEDIKGTLAPGMLADVVVLSRDILRVPEDEIRGTEVVRTIVRGHSAFSFKN